ncbi:MAG TPA: nitric oxide reductase transcriptional regulator NorR [Anaeromyxobacter sp.]|nr:nitric oxide reductase transcriptional regulator NorR [Anaeromyxobacter sp.]
MQIATPSSDGQRGELGASGLAALLEIARDLTASLAAVDRYGRLLGAIRRAIPCDAACLLRLEGQELVPLAGHGLAPAALTRRFDRREHPRLDVILGSREPVRFPPDSALADPFDGLIEKSPHPHVRVHACLGCALTEGGEVVGALTVDALEPHAFDHLDTRFLATLGALAGAAMRTTVLIEALERRVEQRGRVARELQRRAAEASGEIIGTSPELKRVLDEVAMVARSDLAVLVTGETGVGKERVVHQIHALSARRDEALIHVNCAALPEAIAESELFGHVAGAFTGAEKDRAGKFEVADGGTLFLDEVGELPLTLQAKLLRAVQSGEIQRVGTDRVHRVDVRVIAATNRDLEREVARGRFRADLFHRLAAFPLQVPPLRRRREDIPLLAAHFADAARRRLGVGPVRLSQAVRERLAAAEWPGNVRELENVVSRAVLRAADRRDPSVPVSVEPSHLDLAAGPPAPPAAEEPAGPPARPPPPLAERVRDYQRRLIREALERSRGSWAGAARELGLHRSNLHHLAGRLGLRGPRGRAGQRPGGE